MLKNGELITDEGSSMMPHITSLTKEDAVSDGDATHDLRVQLSRNQLLPWQDDPMAVYEDKIMYNLESK